MIPGQHFEAIFTLLVLARKMNLKIGLKSYSMYNFEFCFFYDYGYTVLTEIFGRVAKGIWNGLFWSNPSVV